MRIDFDQILKTPKGEPFRAPVGVQALLAEVARLTDEQPDTTLRDAQRTLIQRWNAVQGEPQTLGDVAYDALLSGDKATKGNAGDKRTRAKLAAKVCQGGIVELAEADLQVLREELERHCTAIALLACDEALVEWKPLEAVEEGVAE
jgi:hypothetical protein